MKAKRLVATLLITPMLIGPVSALAQDDDGPGVFPVETYICNFNEGKGAADLDRWVDKWNAWADSTDQADYSAWTLTPYYFGENQDFDFIWLGTSPDGKTLGAAQDHFLNNAGEVAAGIFAIATCRSHSNFATLNIKQPPDDGAETFFVSFSDCKVEEGKSWDEVQPALDAWGAYRTEQGSQAGIWVMWPAYGGGDAEFDFKYVISHRNLESLGVDYDQYSQGGYEKAEELFSGVMECNESRTYRSVQRRVSIPDEG